MVAADDTKELVKVEFEVQLAPGKTDTFVVEVITGYSAGGKMCSMKELR